MKAIKFTQEAYLSGHAGSFLKYTDEDGKELTGGIWGCYYTAIAEDVDGNEYKVVWEISDREAYEAGDDDCCDWTNPDIIFNECGHNVTFKVILED